ncbi:MAG: exodeoxyribonuclease VII large subunit [Acholeplasmataceae bacterium]|nr:exodeoxyribonuclease VII large subunit [Acholeplasmataceae bacterium]
MEQYLSVSALTKYIKAKLEGDKHLFSILLKGEISNFKKHSRGHFYFTLKDEGAQISAIMFSRDAEKIGFTPKEGDHVLVSGRISLYEPSGTYSIQVSTLKLDGIGELYLKYEQLKKDLEEKGYFKIEHKKPIPKFPKIIGVITSPTGAVIEDIKNTVSRRYLLTEIHLYPALVQGPGSAESIRSQILLANIKNEVDVLIVGRGGGSIEDLWSFNEMPVIQAIYDSRIPIITAIGHETDFTISDFVSDLRAPTPTAAAELATPNVIDIKEKIDEYLDQIVYKTAQYFGQRKTELIYLDQRLERLSPEMKLDQLKIDLSKKMIDLEKNYFYQLENKRYRIDSLNHMMKSPLDKIKSYIERRENLDLRLKRNIESIQDIKLHKFEILRTALGALNPLMMMDKGFAVVSKGDFVITSIKDIQVNDQLNIRFKDGSVGAKVTEKGEK